MAKFSWLFSARKKIEQMRTNLVFCNNARGQHPPFWCVSWEVQDWRQKEEINQKPCSIIFLKVFNSLIIMDKSTLLILDPFRNLRTNTSRGKEYRGIFLESDSLQARWFILWRALWHKQQGISSETLHVKCFHIFLGYQVLMCWDHSVNQ